MSPKARKRNGGKLKKLGGLSYLAIERLRRRLSQKEVAAATNFSQPYVSKAERDGIPDVLYLYRLGKLLKLPLGEFFESYVREKFERVPSLVKIAQTKYQSSPAEKTNLGQQEPCPPSSAPTDSPIDQRDDVDSDASTLGDVGAES